MPKTSNTALLSNRATSVTKIKATAKPSGTKHGYPLADWLTAKDEARKVMIDTCKASDTITYTDLIAHVRAIRLVLGDNRLRLFLDEISVEEDKAGRGLLTAVAVYSCPN